MLSEYSYINDGVQTGSTISPYNSGVLSQFTGMGSTGTTKPPTTGGILGTFSSLIPVIGSLIPVALIENTIGSVFENGFRISCWNVSSSPAEAKRWMENSMQPFFISKINQLKQAQTDDIISNVLSETDSQLRAVEGHQLFHKTQSKSSCSKDGNQIKADMAGTLSVQLQDVTKSLTDYEVTSVVKTIDATTVKVPNVSINWKGRTNRNVSYRVYTAVKPTIITKITGGKLKLAGLSGGFMMPFIIVGLGVTMLYNYLKSKNINLKR